MAARKPEEAHRLFAEAFNAQDLERLMTLYEEEAVLVPQPGAQPVKGKQAIREALGNFLALNGKITVETRSAVQAGELALLRGHWELKGTGPEGQPVEMAHDTTEVVRRQRDGSWRYVIDHPFGAD